MSIKKICKTICAVLILATVISVGVCVGAQRVMNVDDTGYVSHPSVNLWRDTSVIHVNNKYGLVDKNGAVLVEPIYRGVDATSKDGYIIFYEFPESAYLNDYKSDFINENALSNAVYGKYGEGQYEQTYLISGDYNINSYVYDDFGTLVYYEMNSYIASVSEGIMEIRTKPHGVPEDFIELMYRLDYKKISDISTVYSNDNCKGSTRFNGGYAAVSSGYNNTLSLEIIGTNGVLVKKDKEQIKKESGYGGDYGIAFYLYINTDIDNYSVMFSILDCPTVGASYVYNFASNTYTEFALEFGDAYYSYHYNGYKQVFWGDRYVLCSNDINYLNSYLTNTSLSKGYSVLGAPIGYGYFLVETSDGRWGYIDIDGNEYSFYNDASNFINGKALVVDDENRAYVINDKFERISEYIYDVDGVNTTSVYKDGLFYLVTNFNEINGIPELTVTVNGRIIMFDQPPVIENGRTLVPLRAIFEALNATVEWDGATQTVTATKDGTVITVQIGNNIMTKNGAQIALDVPAKLLNGRTLVPARAVAEAFGCNVDWNEAAQHVIITA